MTRSWFPGISSATSVLRKGRTPGVRVHQVKMWGPPDLMLETTCCVVHRLRHSSLWSPVLRFQVLLSSMLDGRISRVTSRAKESRPTSYLPQLDGVTPASRVSRMCGGSRGSACVSCTVGVRRGNGLATCPRRPMSGVNRRASNS